MSLITEVALQQLVSEAVAATVLVIGDRRFNDRRNG